MAQSGTWNITPPHGARLILEIISAAFDFAGKNAIRYRIRDGIGGLVLVTIEQSDTNQMTRVTGTLTLTLDETAAASGEPTENLWSTLGVHQYRHELDIQNNVGEDYYKVFGGTVTIVGRGGDGTTTASATFTYSDGTTSSTMTVSLGNVRKHNFSATAAPVAATDDTTLGYAVGSFWFDVTNDKLYACLDATDGAAVWVQVIDGNLFDANSILKADADDTPVVLTMGASTILARLASGSIVAATPTQIRTLLALQFQHLTADTLANLVSAISDVSTTLLSAGRQTIPILAKAFRPEDSNGAETGDIANTFVLLFDASSDEFARITFDIHKAWNVATTFTFDVLWSSTATDTDGVAWVLEMAWLGDGDALEPTFGTAVVVTDVAQSTSGKRYRTIESAAVTPSGTPAAGGSLVVRVSRDVSDAADTMTEDGGLVQLSLFYTTNLTNDG